ncbi:uncharacterized protein LOC132733367 [Ruditapes philippinarum]|uniref:uncharacterized protein LOC132733367 n=1 Tax=Ruditapes philippinarum TaxID=129788 RepID=UPI00295C3703|nr:uncharacterized protein LOC132733367 [Ruditapes philippinarum]
MGVLLRQAIVTLVVLILILDMHQTAARRKRLCKLKKKKGECVDIIPRKIVRRYKHCKGYDLRKEGLCAKIKGTCMLIETAKGRKMCECFNPGRLFKDQPMNFQEWVTAKYTNKSASL